MNGVLLTSKDSFISIAASQVSNDQSLENLAAWLRTIQICSLTGAQEDLEQIQCLGKKNLSLENLSPEIITKITNIQTKCLSGRYERTLSQDVKSALALVRPGSTSPI